MTSERVVDNLNMALHAMFAEDPRMFLLGEDVLDPYGGAFKVTSGLSTKYPDRVLGTPISENAIVGVANGLALCGRPVIVEIMFGDFVALCFDQIVNVAAKSVSMYGRRLPVPLVVRAPMGGGRGYGPTHSQSLQKHFIGVPDLMLFELSPAHDNLAVFRRMLQSGLPCMFFEPKNVYAERILTPGPIDDLFVLDHLDEEGVWARAAIAGEFGDCLLITSGATFSRALAAARRLILESEIAVTVVVTAQLYPLALEPLRQLVGAAGHVFVVEEGTAGGTWGAEVAYRLHTECWTDLRGPVVSICSSASVIPSARHLEREIIVQTDDIVDRIRGEVRHA